MASATAGRERRYRSHRSSYRPSAVSYDGNAARVLEREEVLQPRPQVRPRERAISRPRIRVREAGRVSVFGVVGFLAVGVFAMLVLLSSVKLAELSDRMVTLSGEIDDLRNEEAKLRARYELAFDLGELERSLTESGMMAKPQSGQVIYLDLSEPDSVMFFQNEEDTDESGLDSVLGGMKHIFGNVLEYFR